MDRNERQRQARATAATETLEERDARLSQRNLETAEEREDRLARRRERDRARRCCVITTQLYTMLLLSDSL